jgi:hypothetical protein
MFSFLASCQIIHQQQSRAQVLRQANCFPFAGS